MQLWVHLQAGETVLVNVTKIGPRQADGSFKVTLSDGRVIVVTWFSSHAPGWKP